MRVPSDLNKKGCLVVRYACLQYFVDIFTQKDADSGPDFYFMPSDKRICKYCFKFYSAPTCIAFCFV